MELNETYERGNRRFVFEETEHFAEGLEKDVGELGENQIDLGRDRDRDRDRDRRKRKREREGEEGLLFGVYQRRCRRRRRRVRMSVGEA